MGIRQLSVSRIKGKMKHKLSSSNREKKRGNGRWQLSGKREREGEWNGKWINKWLVYYNKRQAQWIIKTSIIILYRFYGC